jgi:hypothetical protein
MKVDTSKFTHYARIWGVPCYYNVTDNEISGRGAISDFFLELWAIPFDQVVMWCSSLLDPNYEAQFKIKLFGKIPQDGGKE